MDDLSVTSTSRSMSGYQLVALIDVSTGHQLDPDEPSCAARLRKIQSRCPSSIRFATHHITAENLTKSTSQSVPTLLMELNNFSVVSSCRSLERICDPFGGYAIYLDPSCSH